MGWRRKLDILAAAADEDENLVAVFERAAAGAPARFLSDLQRRFAFLPAEYLEFLAFSDGIQLDQFVLFGSGESTFPALSGLERRWNCVLPRAFPIGEDSGGGVFLLGPDGKVRLAAPQPPHQEDEVAASFPALLDEVFMGPGYLGLFPYGPYADNEWLNFLGKQGWLR